MKRYLDKHFLLESQTGQRLFHETAERLPFIDYHNHVEAQALVRNQPYPDLTALWIAQDPYKHRAMRICGIPEAVIQGKEGAYNTFLAWADVLPKTLGNPLYHWCSMEMKSVFGIEKPLSTKNAPEVWEQVNQQLTEEAYRPISILQKWNPETIITSNDLLEDISEHDELNQRELGFKVLPSLRSDNILAMKHGWLKKLGEEAKLEVTDWESYKEAVSLKLHHFAERGAILADHALDAGFRFELIDEQAAAKLFEGKIQNGQLTDGEEVKLQSFMLYWLGKAYAEKGWAWQLHIGAQRQTSSRLRKAAGAFGGYACIGNPVDVPSLVNLLDSLEKEGALPKTILYTLNPADNPVMASITGSFVGERMPGKVQFGPAWWYNDHYHGITDQLTALTSYGLLSQSIGMTTDSRSLLSFSRHEYFRRILCDFLGKMVEKGQLPHDESLLKEIVKDVSYRNIKTWLEI